MRNFTIRCMKHIGRVSFISSNFKIFNLILNNPGELKKECNNLQYYGNSELITKCDEKNNRTFECIFYYDNKNVYYKCNYADGLKCGEYIRYYENGQIDERGFYKKDKLHGDYIKYFENGNIKFNCKFVDGQIDLFNYFIRTIFYNE